MKSIIGKIMGLGNHSKCFFYFKVLIVLDTFFIYIHIYTKYLLLCEISSYEVKVGRMTHVHPQAVRILVNIPFCNQYHSV